MVCQKVCRKSSLNRSNCSTMSVEATERLLLWSFLIGGNLE